MPIEMTRRALAAGLGGVAAAGWFGLPAFASGAPPIPYPPACRAGAIAPYIIDEVYELHRVACAEWHAERRLLQTGEDGGHWSMLHVLKVDAAAALRSRLGYIAPHEQALRIWMDQIYSLRLGAFACFEDVANTSPALRTDAQRFRKLLLRLPLPGPVPDRAVYRLPADTDEHEALLEHLTATARSSLRITPRTAGDAALHRRAAMVVHDPNLLRYIRANWASIEAVRLQPLSA
jgi:hypothetical protein